MCVPYLREKRGERMGKWFTTQLVFIAGREERKRRRRREMLNNKNLKYLCNNYQLRVFAFLCEPELEDGRDGRSGEREREKCVEYDSLNYIPASERASSSSSSSLTVVPV